MVLPWARISTALAGWPQHGVKDCVPAKVRSVLLSLALALLVPAAFTTAVRKSQVPLPIGGQLAITPRAGWGASRCKPRKTAGYGSVDLAFIHHTDSLNAYSRAQSASVVLGVCLFHRNVNRW